MTSSEKATEEGSFFVDDGGAAKQFKSLLLRSRKPVESSTGFTFGMGFREGESGFESMLRMLIFLSPLCGPRKQRSQSSLNPSFSAQMG